MDEIEYQHHVADPIRKRLSDEDYALVAEWLRDVAAFHGLEDDSGKTYSPTVSWLALAVTFR